ncbi:MAG: sigma-70 family RNA polymerase sigma factor [Deltaproteobacteria bacterium]|nr:sigma-70 family RNA polymerase sigma factor [Deltaproteobacteria bacterium]
MNIEGHARRTGLKGAEVIPLVTRVLSNEEILRGLERGDTIAADAFYERFGDTINRRVWRLLGADADHDDVVQQVFENVLSSIRGLRDPSSLGDWIAGVAVNTVRRELRRRKVRRILVLVREVPDAPALDGGPEEGANARRFYAALDRMRIDDRIVFALRFVDGNTLEDTARLASCSLSTAKRRVERARKAFLSEAGQDPILASLMKEVDHGR